MINQVEPTRVIAKSHLNSIECITGHPSKKIFATGSHDKTIKIWDMEKLKENMQLSDHK
jgi:WD40 repeat protein